MFSIFKKTKKFNFYIIKTLLGSKDNEVIKKVNSLKKECKDGIFDSYVNEDLSYMIFTDFKPDDAYSAKVLEMFCNFTFAYIKKNDLKILKDVLFKEKDLNNNNHIIHLRFNATK